MIPKKARLPRREFHGGAYKTARTPYFLLKAKDGAPGKNRIGVVVGKSVHKTAVRRNFWKRQAKAGLRAEHAAGKDLLMVLSPKVNELTVKQFRELLQKSKKTLLK